ncbi:MAG: antibiotic biosynthesis monooxygenase [Pseudomonadota bacterium]
MSSVPLAASAATLLAKLHLRPGTEEEFTAWQARALTQAARSEGFLSSETMPADSHSPAWTVNLRFRNSQLLESWRQSADWDALVRDAQSLLAKDSSVEIEVKEIGADGGVVEVVVTQVKPGKEVEYRDWETRIQQAQSKFPGYLGSYVQPPVGGELGWTTLMRFQNAAQLEKWLKSTERASLLREAQPLIDYAHLQRVDSSFPGWFPTNPETGDAPPNWKAAMLVLLGLFPIVMLEARFLSPLLASLNSSLSMFIGNTISVALTSFVTMPYFVKAFGFWLFPKRPRDAIVGTSILIVLFVVEVAALWHLL